MATIICPGCNAPLRDYIIEAIASGSKVVGAGGCVCPRCGKLLFYQDIEDLLLKQAYGIPTVPKVKAPPVEKKDVLGIGLCALSSTGMAGYLAITWQSGLEHFVGFLGWLALAGFLDIYWLVFYVKWRRTKGLQK